MGEFFNGFKESFSDTVDAAKAFLRFVNMVMFIFSVVSFLAYAILTLLSFRNNAEYPFFAYFTLAALAIYLIFIIWFIIMNAVAKKNPGAMRNFKISLTVMRQLLKFFNLVLSIVIMVSASTSGFFGTAAKAFLIILSGFSIFLNLAIVVIRIRWAKRRKAKQAQKKRKPQYEDGVPALKKGENGNRH